MDWFKRHLNWTYFIGIALTGIPYLLLLSVESGGGSGSAEWIILIGVMLVITYGLGGWVLWQKGRSLWWLLLSAWLSPLWLPSKPANRKMPSIKDIAGQFKWNVKSSVKWIYAAGIMCLASALILALIMFLDFLSVKIHAVLFIIIALGMSFALIYALGWTLDKVLFSKKAQGE